MDDEPESLSSLNRADLVARFDLLEQKWKTDGTPEGLSNILNIFQIDSPANLVPNQVQQVYSTDWKLYCRIRRELELLDDDDTDNEEQDGGQELALRFARFQENIFYGKETLLCFMRMTNSNSAFPVPATAELLFWHSPISKDDLQPTHVYTLFLLGSLFRLRLRRYAGLVFEQVFLDGNPTHAWREKCDIKTIVRSLSAKETNFEMWKMMTSGLFDPAVKYLTDCIDMEFPDLKIKRRVWSFGDGIYDATEDKFSLYGQHVDDFLVSCKIIEKSFTPVYFRHEMPIPDSPVKAYSEINTAHFESIFAPQEYNADMIKWVFVFIGRLFYEVNEKDSWQVIPFLKGVAGTGKSTVIKVVQKLYNQRDIGVVSNNIERQFGPSTIFDKKIFIVPEMKGDFSLDVAVFQSMITGEEVSLAVKHDSPCVGRWVVPGIMAGNESPNWQDKSGSISRRVVVFDFPNKVPAETSNPNLFANIVESEIPAIIRKATLAYHWAVETYGNADIWTALPPRICEEKKKLQFATNPLFAFMNSDRVQIDVDEYTLESMFISQLKIFTSLKFPGVVNNFTPDTYGLIFADYGIVVEDTVKNWPRSTQNPQRNTYIIGCTVNNG
ncbi:putative superfamily III helicase [Feldmannia species virus]|uniref:Putative superfamily III helicase n=1 Tax=Feldmannia species virus TaxID=39420 RepID=B5LWC3_9PHYC|nr:putative superfamily III helicase [Feldmannia species virus]ACH46786.1 putative superfamily III helicase [Feldmannia species virus]